MPYFSAAIGHAAFTTAVNLAISSPPDESLDALASHFAAISATAFSNAASLS